MSAPDIKSLRRDMRRRRQALSPKQVQDAGRAVARQANKLYRLKSASVVLSYLPVAGEIPPELIVRQLPAAQLLLPRISHFTQRKMRFYPATNALQRNRYGIVEPAAAGSPVPARQIDAVLLPLVAFDRSGSRMGMGGGYYDRAFEFCLNRRVWRRPFLIGVAHAFQEVESLQRQVWDVPLDAIITDRELIALS